MSSAAGTRPFAEVFTKVDRRTPKSACVQKLIGPGCPLFPQVPFSCTPPPHQSESNRMGQPGPPSPSLPSPERPASTSRAAANRPRRAVDVSQHRGLGQGRVSTPSEGQGAPFPPRPAPPHPSPSAPCFPSLPPIYRRVVPPPSNGFRWIWPERTLSTKCSLFPSNRGGFTPVSATKSPLRRFAAKLKLVYSPRTGWRPSDSAVA